MKQFTKEEIEGVINAIQSIYDKKYPEYRKSRSSYDEGFLDGLDYAEQEVKKLLTPPTP